MERLLLLGSSLFATLVAAEPSVRYGVAVAAALTTLRVEACVERASAEVAFTLAGDAGWAAIREPIRTSGAAVTRSDERLEASDWQAGECLRYAVDIETL